MRPKGGGKYFRAAELAARWFLNTQAPENPYKGDANAGRYLFNYNVCTKKVGLSGCWCTAIGMISLAAMHRRTKDKIYLDSARRAAAYLMTLQITDPAHPHRGAFREWTPQTDWCFPRDGVTSAWAFLCLYRLTREKELLRRAELFAEWYFRRAKYTSGFAKGWTRNFIKLDGPPPPKEGFNYLGNFQAGAGVFFHNLFKTTGRKIYLTKGILSSLFDIKSDGFDISFFFYCGFDVGI